MYPAPIDDYLAPTGLNDALRALAAADEDDTLCLAGGMSAMQAIKARLLRPRRIVDLSGIGELKGIATAADGVRIGAMTRYVEVAAAPELAGPFAALRDAAAHVGDRQVRNRGTVGGSLCWNYVAACTPVATLAVGAVLELASLDGDAVTTRNLAIDDFLGGPLETARTPDEILVAIHLEAGSGRSGSAYRKWGPATDALPVVAVGARVWLDADGRCAASRVALGGLATGPTRLPSVEAALVGSAAADLRDVEAIFATVTPALDLQGDSWASADYRRHLIQTIGAEVIGGAFRRAGGGQP